MLLFVPLIQKPMRMKSFVLFFIFFLAFNTYSQDTTDLYVINNTNRLVKLGEGEYAFIYRDLKSLKEIRSIDFDSNDAMSKFFDLCFKALEKDQGTVTEHYNVSRNKLSKNVVRVNDKQGGYFLLKYETLEHMKSAFSKG